jgi:hypothetical protein
MLGASIVELATERQRLYDIFNGKEIDDDASDLEFERINAIESTIENATFETDADKLAGLMILFELDDAPDFADRFKAKLFSRIHQFA